MKKIKGLDAYDIMEIPECPISLPTARSMTQARIDFYHIEDQVLDWYKNFNAGCKEGRACEQRRSASD